MKAYFRQRETIGEESYRLSLCMRFTNKRLNHDLKLINQLNKKYNLTNEINEKIIAMMLVKCQNSLPKNMTKKVRYITRSILYRKRRRLIRISSLSSF